MTAIILVRHGRIRRLADDPDPSLTALGEQEAGATARALAADHVDALYASDLLRARETAAILARFHGLNVRIELVMTGIGALRAIGTHVTMDRPQTRINCSRRFEMVHPEPQRDRPHFPAGYGTPTDSNGLLPWQHVGDRVNRSKNFWIATVDGAGRPHATPVWGVWLDSTFYFDGSPETRRGRNIAQNVAVTVS